MNDKEKLLWLFEQVHGEIGGSCYTEVVYDDHETPIAVKVMKHGNLCWSADILSLLFEYVTRDAALGKKGE